MTTYAKPSVLPAWGETNTTSADMVQPANATIQTGFPLSATPPARQTFNWLFNWCANAIRYFMQRGMVDYDRAETYGLNARVIGDDGNTYVSLESANTGNTPSSSPTAWARWGLKLSDIPAPNLSGYAPLASPVFTGNPTAPTPAAADNDTSIATTSFVQTAIAAVQAWVNGLGLASTAWVESWVFSNGYAPSSWVQTYVAGLNLAPLASPALTGSPTAPTQAAADNSTKIATTAFVNSAVATSEPIVPAHTVLTNGSGTYNTPAGARLLHVRMVGPGGGGGGGGTTGAGIGGTGTDTTFGTLTAHSGTGGIQGSTAQANAAPGGGGGSATGGALNITGGFGIPYYGETGMAGGSGGLGGPSAFGGAPNAPGSGGSGGNVNNTSYTGPGGGGGAGGYLEHWIPAPAASYSYSVGTGGAAGIGGSNGNAGTAGAPGVIIIEAL